MLTTATPAKRTIAQIKESRASRSASSRQRSLTAPSPVTVYKPDMTVATVIAKPVWYSKAREERKAAKQSEDYTERSMRMGEMGR